MAYFKERYLKGSNADKDIFQYLLLPDPKTGVALTKSQVAEEPVVVAATLLVFV
jgi:hypothetical protein